MVSLGWGYFGCPKHPLGSWCPTDALTHCHPLWKPLAACECDGELSAPIPAAQWHVTGNTALAPHKGMIPLSLSLINCNYFRMTL